MPICASVNPAASKGPLPKRRVRRGTASAVAKLASDIWENATPAANAL